MSHCPILAVPLTTYEIITVLVSFSTYKDVIITALHVMGHDENQVKYWCLKHGQGLYNMAMVEEEEGRTRMMS